MAEIPRLETSVKSKKKHEKMTRQKETKESCPWGD